MPTQPQKTQDAARREALVALYRLPNYAEAKALHALAVELAYGSKEAAEILDPLAREIPWEEIPTARNRAIATLVRPASSHGDEVTLNKSFADVSHYDPLFQPEDAESTLDAIEQMERNDLLPAVQALAHTLRDACTKFDNYVQMCEERGTLDFTHAQGMLDNVAKQCEEVVAQAPNRAPTTSSQSEIGARPARRRGPTTPPPPPAPPGTRPYPSGLS